MNGFLLWEVSTPNGTRHQAACQRFTAVRCFPSDHHSSSCRHCCPFAWFRFEGQHNTYLCIGSQLKEWQKSNLYRGSGAHPLWNAAGRCFRTLETLDSREVEEDMDEEVSDGIASGAVRVSPHHLHRLLLLRTRQKR